MKVITDSLKTDFDRGWGFLTKLIDVCPEVLWNKKAGGYLFWQHMYHCFGCIDYFIGAKEGTPDAGPLGMDVVMFKAEPAITPTKEDIKAYAAKMKAKADAWVATLDDVALTLPNEGFSARKGMPMTNALVLSIMAGHSFYHVGNCDAVLRDNGEKGVY